MTQDQPGTAKKAQRPRDELGRPLPWGAENMLQIQDYDALPVEEDHRLAIESFNAGNFFAAHEAWESAWRKVRGTGDEEFFHGLAQLGAGFTHYRRGNPHGARTLLARAVRRLSGYAPAHHGIEVAALVEATRAIADAIDDSRGTRRTLPEIEFPRIER
jgi:hypothetical protein